MDSLDSKIIDILRHDGRIPNARIARIVGVSEGTVRRRLRQLVEGNYISIVALINLEKMGLVAEGLIGVQVDPDKIDEVANELAELEQISWVSVTTGSYDIFCWAALPSSEELGKFLRSEVGTIKGVRSTETFVNLATKKRGFGVSL